MDPNATLCLIKKNILKQILLSGIRTQNLQPTVSNWKTINNFYNSQVKSQTKPSIVQIENMGHNIILFSITQQNYEYNPYFQLK